MSSKPKAQTRYSIQQATKHPVAAATQASDQQDSAATVTTIQKSPKVTPSENPWISALL
jgi:hypothetical protein